MKNTRLGLGRGMGCGYKNLVPKDPFVHSMSAKGVKTWKKTDVPYQYTNGKLDLEIVSKPRRFHFVVIDYKKTGRKKLTKQFESERDAEKFAKEYMKLNAKGITSHKSSSLHVVSVRADKPEQVAEATNLLTKYLRDFVEKNKQFNFQGSVIDKDGNEANFLVDFGVEDNETDFYYVANIGGKTKGGKPFEDWTNVEAFLTASDIIESAVGNGVDYQQGYMEWDTGGTDMYNPKKGMFDASIPIIWRQGE